MQHVGIHRDPTKLGHHGEQLFHTLLVGRDLGPQVGNGLLRIARWIGARAQRRQQLGFAHRAATHQQEVVKQHAFFVDGLAEGRHRSGRAAANVGMVAA